MKLICVCLHPPGKHTVNGCLNREMLVQELREARSEAGALPDLRDRHGRRRRQALDDRKTHRLALLERRFFDLDLHAPEPIEIATCHLEST